MNVNIINLSDVIGGQEIYIVNLLKVIKTKNRIKMFVNRKLWEENFDITTFSVELIDIKDIKYSSFLYIKKEIQRHIDYDDICVFNGNRAIYLGSLFSERYKKIAIQHSSIADVQNGILKTFFRTLMYRILVKRYDRIIGVSQNSIKIILDNKNVYCVKNGIDPNKFHPISKEEKYLLRKRMGFNAEDRIILMVGTLTDNKGQLESLNIIKKLDERYKLVLVGDGPDKITIINKVIENNLDRRVKLVGQVKEVEKYYWISDVLLFLSKNEGLPLTILEAMSTGLPIFTTKTGGIPEVVNDFENGFFINRNEHKKNALYIQKLLDDTENIKRIRDNNIEKIKTEFTLKNCVSELVQHLEAVFKKNYR